MRWLDVPVRMAVLPHSGEGMAMEGMRRGILGDFAGGPCPSADLLAGYAGRKLGAVETQRVEEHLSGCRNCRSDALFCVVPELLEISETRRAIALRVLVPDPSGIEQLLFEATVSLMPRSGELPSPVLRGPLASEARVSRLVVGPFVFSLKPADPGSEPGVHLQVTRADEQLPGVIAELELVTGRRLSGLTDRLGWVFLAGIVPENICAIWIHASS